MAIQETKKLKPDKKAPLRLILVNMSGSWKWLTGEEFRPNTIIHRVMETWRTARKRLLHVAGPSRIENLTQRAEITIDSEEWENHWERWTIYRLAEAKGEAEAEDCPERLYKIQGYRSIEAAWRATLISVSSEENGLGKFKEELKQLEFEIMKREDLEDQEACAICIYNRGELGFTASYIGAEKTNPEDAYRQLANEINKGGENSAAQIAQKLIWFTKDSGLNLKIIALQNELAGAIREECDETQTRMITIITLWKTETGMRTKRES